jgi:hypothetical protein
LAIWRDEFELLCEWCGYSLAGLGETGGCPECGRAIAESLPQRRLGSPWQQHPGVAGWLKTVWACSVRPQASMGQVAFARTPVGLYLCNIAVLPAFLWLGVLVWILVYDMIRPAPTEPDEYTIGTGLAVVWLCLLGALSWCAWLAVTAATLGCAAVLLRAWRGHLPALKRGLGVIVAHASCAVVPVPAVLFGVLVLSGEGPWPARVLWYATPAGGLLWFGWLCAIGSRPRARRQRSGEHITG